jgi:hypothetical protein
MPAGPAQSPGFVGSSWRWSGQSLALRSPSSSPGTGGLASSSDLSSLAIGCWTFSHPMGMGRDLPPDLPLLFEGSPKVGLGLYNSVAAALVTDLGLLVGGIVVYLVSTRAKDRTGTLAFWLTVLFIVMLALPAAVPGLSILATLALVLLLPLGNWVDRHRSLAAASLPRVS